MAKHICIRIYDDGNVKVTKEQEKDEVPRANDVNIGGKALNFAFWYKENPTCVVYNGVKY